MNYAKILTESKLYTSNAITCYGACLQCATGSNAEVSIGDW